MASKVGVNKRKKKEGGGKRKITGDNKAQVQGEGKVVFLVLFPCVKDERPEHVYMLRGMNQERRKNDKPCYYIRKSFPVSGESFCVFFHPINIYCISTGYRCQSQHLF